MPAAVEPPNVLVGHVGNHFTKLVIGAKKVLAHVSTIIGPVFLILAINRLFHALAQNALGVASQQRIPIGAPDHLDDIPTGAAEKPFKLLNDLAVAAHRTVEALQVAVDHKDEVVEMLAPGQRNGTQRLRLVHFAIAEKAPYRALAGIGHAAIELKR